MKDHFGNSYLFFQDQRIGFVFEPPEFFRALPMVMSMDYQETNLRTSKK
jgi:hypothetical protein